MRVNFIVAGLFVVTVATCAVGAAFVWKRLSSHKTRAPVPVPMRGTVVRHAPPVFAPLSAVQFEPRRTGCVAPPGGACISGWVSFSSQLGRAARDALHLEMLSLTAWKHGSEDARRFDPDAGGCPDDDEEVDPGDRGENAPAAAALKLTDGDNFALTLAEGLYDLEVRGHDESIVGWKRGVRVIPQVDQTGIVLELQPTVAFSGKVTTEHGSPIADAQVRVLGTRPGLAWCASSAVDGTFDLAGVDPGKHRVDVSADGFRAWVDDSRTIDGSAFHPRLVRGPLLIGAVGLGPDTECPTDLVTITDGHDVVDTIHLGDDCAFATMNLPLSGRIVVTARGVDEVTLEIPPVGDIAPVCIGPPCDADQAVVLLWPGPISDRTSFLTVSADEHGWGTHLSEGTTMQLVDGFQAGELVSIATDGADAVEVLLTAGLNEVRLSPTD